MQNLESNTEARGHLEHRREELEPRAKDAKLIDCTELCPQRKEAFPVKCRQRGFQAFQAMLFLPQLLSSGASQEQHTGKQGCAPIKCYEC